METVAVNFWIDGTKDKPISILLNTSIKDLKKFLDKIVPTIDYTVKFVFNNGTELDPEVFNTTKYDDITFAAQENLLKNSNIYITTIPEKVDPCVGRDVVILFNSTEDRIMYASTSMEKVLKDFINRFYGEKRLAIDLNLTNIDYTDPDIVKYIHDKIDQVGFGLYVDELS